MKQSVSFYNTLDAGSGLSTLYQETSTNTLTWGGLQSGVPEFLKASENEAFGHLHPFPSLKKLWEMKATQEIALSSLTEIYAVNAASFVSAEYPPNPDGSTFTVTEEQTVLVKVKSAVVWAIIVWSVLILIAGGALFYFCKAL